MFSWVSARATDLTPQSVEPPVLWLGLAGFSAGQGDAIARMLARSPGLPKWQIRKIADADAWLLNGAQCRVRSGENLEIAPGQPSEKRLRLDLSDVDRPVAFAAPVPGELDARCTFDPGSQASVQAMLLQFDVWLRLERAQFELGAQVIRLGAALRHGIFHLVHQGNLLAVLDFRKGQAGLSPMIHPADVQQAEWHKRPAGAAAMPPGFVASSPAQLAWTYVRRSDRDMLPQHYREQMIYFRRVPRVPMRLLGDTQLLLLRELSVQPSKLADLVERTTGIATPELDRAVACLYYAGSITTTPSKAARPHGTALGDSVRDSSNPASLLGAHARPLGRDELTAPAVLKRDMLQDD